MSSGPPLGTLWIESLPQTNPEYVIGIDTAFFNVNEVFKGLKAIPPGLHLFHYSEGDDMRAGWWFEIHEHQVVSIYWDCELERFMTKAVDMEKVANGYQFMVSYPEDIDNWTRLTRHIQMSDLETIGPKFPEPVTTATPSKEENIVLAQTLRERDPKQEFEDQSSSELGYTIVQFRDTGARDGQSDEDVTRNALDRSWQLDKLYCSPRHVMSELQVSFIYFCVIANLCSCTQWLSLLRLVSSSENFLQKDKQSANALLELFLAQLQKIPEEYMGTTELGVVDMKQFVEVLEKLSSIFKGNERWQAMDSTCQSRFGIHIRNLETSFDADNFEIYNLDDHDADDEDAPLVVS
ncbi:hypothetical protein FT663_02762 [Candidozyma haemuli var. vulneris]|uniref:A1 cistron-splicing factor AAR2 n=1 Tax=Candidozyma haemuli TaxID=45357 RepID=A0A2V1AUZ9_9ASCO|nr:hypothetical protein CXQ85_000331 [[Candida] haemuloni]KAF3989398.1 hypothetical protein FT662_02851 [[Candida] haemuloni var. vulneris]KAF3991355.1 hypothetical protein FT663_02762 [[Candida] haemuloni var. vulneris]PVH21356.1 hypothetical protein CXQ85_000331 [[Candida] haemuloni]